MTVVNTITDQPKQTMVIQNADGTSITLTLYYRVQQYAWFYDISWDGLNPPFKRTGQQLVVNPNILRTARNILTFGLSVMTTDGADPAAQDDFSSGYATMALLSPAEVQTVEGVWFSKLI